MSLLMAVSAFLTPVLSYAGSKEVGTFYSGDSKLLNYPQEVWGYSNKVGGATSSAPDLVEVVRQDDISAEIRVVRAYPGTSTRVAITVDYYEAKYNYKRQSYVFWLTVKPIPIEMNTTSITISEGDRYQLSYRGTVSGKGNPSATWSSSNGYVARVSQTGMVEGVAGGTATVYATTTDGEVASCYVTVEAINRDPESVSLPGQLTVYVGEKETLTPSLFPSDAQTSFTWYSEDKNIAKVSNGTVEGVSEGNTNVYCYTANNLKSNLCKVSVQHRVPSSVEIKPASVYLPLNQTAKLSYSVQPSNAKYTVEWSSENPGIATVSETGYVEPVSPGRTRIKIRTDNNKTAYCQVTVPPDPDLVALPDKTQLLLYGEQRQLTASVYPSDAYQSLSWKSDSPQVAAVAQDGTITAKGAGTATITVATHNGKEATCRVEVPEPDFRFYVWTNNGQTLSFPLKEHPRVSYADDRLILESGTVTTEYQTTDIRKFTLSNEVVSPMPTSIWMTDCLDVQYGQSEQLYYVLYPDDYDFVTSLTWSSSDPKVASVSQDGCVTAVGGGEADITLTATNGCSATCHVTVPEPDFYFIVWLNNGRKTVCHLSDKPLVKYADDKFVLTTTSETVEYDAQDVRKFTLADSPDGDEKDGIISLQSGDRHAVALDHKAMLISGGTPYASTQIFTAGGMLAGEYKADADGNTLIPLTVLPKGVIIVKSGTLTYKIIRK